MYKKILILMLMFLLLLTACSSDNKEELKNYTLDIQALGQGQVKNSGNPDSEDRQVTLTAQPQKGDDDWAFDHWQGAIGGSKNPVTVLAEGDMQIISVFKDVPNFTDSVDNIIVLTGDSINFTIDAEDSDSEELDYSVVSADEQLRGCFDLQRRKFSHSGLTEAGDYKITFKVSDGKYYTEKTITITALETINNEDSPPLIGTITAKKVNEGSVLSFLVTSTDPDGDEITLSAESLPRGAEFDSDSGQFIWIPDYEQAGSYEVNFTAEANGKSDSQTVIITVDDFVSYGDTAPVIADIDDKYIDENKELTFTMRASDPDGDSVSLSSTNLPDGATFNNNSGEFSWIPGYDQPGVYNLTFSATANGKQTDENINITVNNVLHSFNSLSADKAVYEDSNTIKITADINEPGLNVTADFTNIDDKYTKGQESVSDNGDNTYTITYTIDSENSREDGTYTIPVTAVDFEENSITDNSLSLKLDNTKKVETAEELRNAVALDYVHTIFFTDNISQDFIDDNKITRPLTIDFGSYTLNGDILFQHTETAKSVLRGEIGDRINGNLEVDTPNASFDNNVGVSGNITITDVKADSWAEKVDGNNITLTDGNGSTIVIEGNSNNIVVDTDEDLISPIITVKEGSSISTITTDAVLPLTINLENNTDIDTLAGTGDVEIIGQGIVDNITNTGNVSAEEINTIYSDNHVANVDNNIIFAAAPSTGITVWIAPAGTTLADLDSANSNMTKLVGDGNTNTMSAPGDEGVYRVMSVDNNNISESISELRAQDVDTVYTTIQSVTSNTTVTLDDAPITGMTAWIAADGTTAANLDENNDNMTKLNGDGNTKTITAPKTAGTYRVILVDSYGNLAESTAQIDVVPAAPTSFTAENYIEINQGQALTLIISNLQDEYGNLVDGVYDLSIIENIDGLTLARDNVTFIDGAGSDIQLLSSSDTRNISAGRYYSLDVKVGNVVEADSFNLKINPVLNEFNVEAESINQGEIVDIEIGSFKDLNGDRMYLSGNENIEIRVSNPYGSIFYNEEANYDLSSQNNTISLTSFNTEVPHTWYIYRVVIRGITEKDDLKYIYPVPDPDRSSASAHHISDYTNEMEATIYDKAGDPIWLLHQSEIKLVVENMEDDDGDHYLYIDRTLSEWGAQYPIWDVLPGHEPDYDFTPEKGKFAWRFIWNEENKDSEKRIFKEWRIKAKYPTNDDWTIIHCGTNLDVSK